MQKLLLAHGGGGGDDILKKSFRISIYFNVKLIGLPKIFSSLKHLISKTDFIAIKYSGQGIFKVKKGTIDELLFLLKTIGIYP